MAVIFAFSAQPADESSEVSARLGEDILTVANQVFRMGWSIGQIVTRSEEAQHLIRKAAHFTEYTFLGAFLFIGFSRCMGKTRVVRISFVVGAVYAISDELHQYFVPGRSARLSDVLIDSAGVLTGVLVSRVITKKLHPPQIQASP